MIINGKSLLRAAPIKDMLTEKKREHGVSYGLSEAGYDIRIKQQIKFNPEADDRILDYKGPLIETEHQWSEHQWIGGRFTIASAIEEFQMPTDLVGIVHDKSTWARKGLSVFNTVIEPGWNGFLTLELVFHGNESITIPAGAGIAQVIFTRTIDSAAYDGKYQNQKDEPVAARFEK